MQKQWLGVLFIAPSVAALTIAASASGLFQMLEWATLDRYFRWRPLEPIEQRIAIVTIDDSDLQKIGKWPIPDDAMAKAIANIKAQQPKAIGLDIYRDLPVPPGSKKLDRVFRSTPNLIGVEKKIADRILPPPTLSQLGQVALADLILDADGKVRRGLISIRTHDDKTQLGLAANLSLTYLESKGISLRVADAKNKQLRLGKAIFQAWKSNDGGYINADAGGYQILLNFRGSIDRFHTISFTDVLQNRMARSLLRDRIVLIGATGQSLNDLFVTPLLGDSLKRTPGVVIHANLISQILSAAIDGRPLIQVWSEPLEWLWIFFWSGCGATLASIFPRKRWVIVSILFIECSLLGGSYLMFLNGWWIPVVAPMLALLVSAISNTCYILIENIKLSHQQLEEYSRHLELKVKERTLELEHKKDQLEEQAIELAAAKEAALAASAAKSSFLANMSHELRTPLNAILGFSQLMVRHQFSETEKREYLEIINRSGEHLLALINDVLEISKIESGLVELKEGNCNLPDLLNSVKEMLKLKAESKGLQIIFDLALDVPQFIKTDENKLRQILINLLGNAIKFTEKGSVSLKVKRQTSNVKIEIEEKITLQLEVEDTGPGIAPDELDLLFQSFVQTQTGRQSGQGTGLGLSISRKFVQLMGGDITVSSILGKGTIFRFDIQVALANETVASTSQSYRQVIGLECDRTYRILVAEDEKENRQLLVKLLTSVGFEVQEASNGQEAIALWSNWQPHLIWMSMRMPLLDGYEATKQIKATDRGQSTIVIALTASSFADEQNRIFSVGCNDFVRKPFQEQVIFETMAQHLGVRYLYEVEKAKNSPEKPLAEITNHTPNSSQMPDILIYKLSAMPTKWLVNLYDETARGNDDLIYKLIDQIPESNAELADLLRQLVYDYRFEEILKSIKSILPTLDNYL